MGDVQLSPDGARVAYTVTTYDGPGRPGRQLFVMTLADGRSVRLGGEETASSPQWSPDGRLIAFKGTAEGRRGLVVARPDGTGLRFLAETSGTNSPLHLRGATVAWSPDSKRIAFVSATPGPETEAGQRRPVVITRYLYKPDAEEGLTRFNDNRRRHIFLVDAAGGAAASSPPATSRSTPSTSRRTGARSPSSATASPIPTCSTTRTCSPSASRMGRSGA